MKKKDFFFLLAFIIQNTLKLDGLSRKCTFFNNFHSFACANWMFLRKLSLICAIFIKYTKFFLKMLRICRGYVKCVNVNLFFPGGVVIYVLNYFIIKVFCTIIIYHVPLPNYQALRKKVQEVLRIF